MSNRNYQVGAVSPRALIKIAMASLDSIEDLPWYLKTVTNAFALLLIVDPFQIMNKGKIIKEVDFAVGGP